MTIPLKYRSQSNIQYDLAEFRVAYDLEEAEAARIYSRYGPSAIELDALMRAKTLRGQFLAGYLEAGAAR